MNVFTLICTLGPETKASNTYLITLVAGRTLHGN